MIITTLDALQWAGCGSTPKPTKFSDLCFYSYFWRTTPCPYTEFGKQMFPVTGVDKFRRFGSRPPLTEFLEIHVNKLLLSVLVLFLTACKPGGSSLEGTYENVAKPGMLGEISLTINSDKTAKMVDLKKGVTVFEKNPYNVTGKILQIQELAWPLTIYDDGSLDGSLPLGVFKKK